MKNQEWTRLSVCGDSHTLFSVFPSISACSTCNTSFGGYRVILKYRLLLCFWTFLGWRLALSSMPRYFPQMPSEKHVIIIAVLLVLSLKKKKMFSSNGWKISNATFIHFLKCVCFLFHKVEWLDSKGLSFPGGTSGKEPICQCRKCRRPRFDPWIIRKIPWRREWQPTPVFLPEEYHGKRSLADCNP